MQLPNIPIGSRLSILSSRIKQSLSSSNWQDVYLHYSELRKAGLQLIEPSLLSSILKACSHLSYRHGKSIHACLVKQGFDSFTSIGNSILDFHMKCGVLDAAVDVFHGMRSRDSVSWNIMIHGFLEQGASREGLCWFTLARAAGFEPNVSTLVLIIQACRSLRITPEGPKIHAYIISSGFGDMSSVQNSLLSMYADSDMESARELFVKMCDRDVISWSVMIGGYVQIEKAGLALQLFREMESGVTSEPDGVTMVSVLKACTDFGDISVGRLFHGFVICRGFDLDFFVGNSLVDMYSKYNDADSALKVFGEMPQRNIVSWNSILSGLVYNGKHSEALDLFGSMREAGIGVDEVTFVSLLQICKYFCDPYQCKCLHSKIIRQCSESNELVINSLLDAYAKCNLLELAWKLFDRLKIRDMVSWSTMIAGFTHCGKPDDAIDLFQYMNTALEKPNTVTILNLLEACAVSAELKKSKWAHGIAIRRGLAAEVAVGTSILDMYSKCGAVEASRKAFNQIPQKNVVSWGAMISAYGMNGLAAEALASFAEMKLHGLKPNSVTALSVLSACSHGGFVEEGLSFFKDMVRCHDIEPSLEHYSCLVDMLARAGKLDHAMDLIKNMPKGYEAGVSLWGAFLSACRSYGNSELGAAAVSRVLELEPSNSAGYMLVSSLYAAGGLWVNSARIRLLVKERGLRIVAGYSLVNVDHKACRFVAGDEFHPQVSEIRCVVKQLHECMKMDERNDTVVFEW